MSKTRFMISNGVAQIVLSQPEKHNAFDDLIISELIEHIKSAENHKDVKAILLEAEGKNFCAGADLAWMKRMAKLDYTDNLADARNLALLMQTLNNTTLPTVVAVQGAAYGGAIGLIACCDIAISTNNAKFCLSEVKLGLAPATIGPYVVDAMGARRCRQLFTTAKVFDANEAYDYGLIHEVVPSEQLTEATQSSLKALLSAGPQGVRAAKQLINTIQSQPEDLIEQTSQLIASLRVSNEGQEGLTAFFDKRKPNWIETS